MEWMFKKVEVKNVRRNVKSVGQGLKWGHIFAWVVCTI